MNRHDFIAEKKAAGAGRFSTPGAAKQYPPDLDLEPLHLEIALRVDVIEKTAAGSVATEVKARREGVNAITLNAIDHKINEVADSEGRKVVWQYDGEKIRVSWVDGFSKDERRKLVIHYAVEHPVSGLYFSQPDSEYPDLGLWAATDHETERARYWLPCVDLPNVRTQLDFHLSAEERFTILANGALQSEERSDEEGWKTAHWKLEQRCPSYLVSFAIGEFVECQDGEFDGKPIAYYCDKSWTAADLERSFGRTREMLEWITAKLDQPYPFPKYYQFALPGVGGAMENISLVSWDDKFVMNETLAQEWTWLVDQINLHEMAHTWFGDHVVCRDFAHAWLKESWAVYIETCYLEDIKGEDEKLYDFYRNCKAYMDEADGSYSRPIVTREFVSSWEMYDRHLYPGGAARLHTLRSELGDDVFWAGTRDYLRRYAGEVVETEDFRQVMEEHSGRSLVKFFDQWIYTAGYPDIKVSFSYNAEKKRGTFEVEQKQAKEDPKDPAKSVKPFDLQTEIGWVVDDVLLTRPVHLTQKHHSFTVEMSREPDQVRFDPNAMILHKLEFNPGDKLLRNQLSGAKDVIGRIQAAYELAKTGKAYNIEAIGDAFGNEPFWGVRQQMAEAVTATNRQTAVEVMVHMVEREQDPLVMESLFRHAGRYRDGHIAAALQARLNDGLPYRATAAVLESLGKQRASAPFEVLTKAATREDPTGFVQGGAFMALAHTGDERALEQLMIHADYGSTSFRSRPYAALALGTLAKSLPKERRARVIERLEDLLRDTSWQMRRMAAMAIGQTGEPAGAGALEAYRMRVPLEDRVGIDKSIARLRKSGDSGAASLQEQFDKLFDDYRKLEARLAKLENTEEDS